MTERRSRKPTPPPKTPPLARRGVAAIAMGLGLSVAACGGEVQEESSPPQPTPHPEKDSGTNRVGDEAGWTQDDASSPSDAGLSFDTTWITPLPMTLDASITTGDAAGDADSSEDAAGDADSSEDAAHPPPPLPPPPPPLPPPPLPPK